MASYIPNNIVYYASLGTDQIELLSTLRHAADISIGYVGSTAWVKGLTLQQSESVAIQSIPGKKLYYEKEGKLFPKGSLLPSGTIPICQWTSINQVLKLELPSVNNNYFGLHQQLEVQLIPSYEEQYPAAMLTSFEILEKYVATAAEVRFRDMFWLLAGDAALITGTPLLPIPGTVYWRKGLHLIPLGYHFEYPALLPALQDVLPIQQSDLIVWNKSGNYWIAGNKKFRELNRTSVRKSKILVHGRD